MPRKTRSAIALLSATMLAAAPVTLAATAITVGFAEPAVANNGKGNGGGRGGERSSSSKDRSDSSRGNGNRGGRGNERSASAKDRSVVARGNGNGRGSSEARPGGGRSLMEALGLKRRVVVVRRAPSGAGAASAVRSSPKPTARPGPSARAAADAEAEIRGNSWKTRLDGDLTTHPSELGHWNSAKRSPVAIANMAEKYRRTGDASGAGGQIGALVVAYEDYGSDVATFQSELDAAIEAGLIDEAQANRLIEGSLNEDAFAQTLAALEAQTEGAIFVFDETSGTYSCDDTGGGDCSFVLAGDIDALNSDAAFLESLGSNPEFTDLNSALGDFDAANASLEDANATVQPNKSTDPDVQEVMLSEVLDLLDLEAPEPELYEIPDEEATAPLPETGTAATEG